MIRKMTRSPKTTRVRIATLTVAALALVVTAAPPVQAAGLINCNVSGATTPCFERVWANGVQLKMRFVNLTPKPSTAPTDNFYVMAPQTGAPQGTAPFLHDHLIGDVRPQNQGDDRGDNRGDNRVRYHGYFVLCSAQGISSGGCVPTRTTIPGLGAMPLTKTVNGQLLTSVAPIEAPANAGLLTLFDTEGVLIATIKQGE